MSDSRDPERRSLVDRINEERAALDRPLLRLDPSAYPAALLQQTVRGPYDERYGLFVSLISEETGTPRLVAPIGLFATPFELGEHIAWGVRRQGMHDIQQFSATRSPSMPDTQVLVNGSIVRYLSLNRREENRLFDGYRHAIRELSRQ